MSPHLRRHAALQHAAESSSASATSSLQTPESSNFSTSSCGSISLRGICILKSVPVIMSFRLKSNFKSLFQYFFFLPKGQNNSCQSLTSIQRKAESFKWKTIPSVFMSHFKVFDSILSTPLMRDYISHKATGGSRGAWNCWYYNSQSFEIMKTVGSCLNCKIATIRPSNTQRHIIPIKLHFPIVGKVAAKRAYTLIVLISGLETDYANF